MKEDTKLGKNGCLVPLVFFPLSFFAHYWAGWGWWGWFVGVFVVMCPWALLKAVGFIQPNTTQYQCPRCHWKQD
jgi:hypothetical protein